MAEFLKRKIYHEKQEQGSMLCAQHALNNLLQGNFFTGPDLAALARELDSLEQSVDDDNRGVSTNMDDTGFFSVQVLEQALRVWGLSLERWRSPQMREFQSKPHTQLGFILNLELHWFTLRRFGPAVTDPTIDPGVGHWFNLNSFLSEPEWVSKTYLGMVLQQAEAEGYSVFVVQQLDQNRPLALARTEADHVAETIPEITGFANHPTLSTARTINKAVAPGPSKSGFDLASAGLEGEDLELQAALQASLQANTSTSASSPLVQTNPTRTSTSANDWNFPSTSSVFGTRTETVTAAAPSPAHIESLDSSARRAREELARFQQEQEEVLRETYEDEIALGNRVPALGSASVTRRRAAQPDEEEEEMLRRAIEASRQDFPEPSGSRPAVAEEEEDDDDTFDDDYMEIDDDEDEHAYLEKVLREKREYEESLASAARTSASSYARARGSLATGIVSRFPPHRVQPTYEGLGLTGTSSRVPDVPPVIPPLVGITGSNASHLEDARYYDDEDAMLQAALRASLEDHPADFVVPEPAPKPITPEARGATSTSTSAPSAPGQRPVASPEPKTTVEAKDESEGDEEDESESEGEAPKPLTAEQLRAARLARFGG